MSRFCDPTSITSLALAGSFRPIVGQTTPEKIKTMLAEESQKRKEERERLRAIEKAKKLDTESVKPDKSIDDQMYG